MTPSAAMVKQPLLFDDADLGAALPALGVPGSQATLGKEQKLFNKLIGKIETQRKLLRQWRDFEPVYHQRVAAEFTPLIERLREARIALVVVLDRAMDSKALGTRHRAKVRDILLVQLSELLDQSQDAELVRLYDKHSDLSFEEQQQSEADFVEKMARSLFGVELEPDHGAATPEALSQLIGERIEAERARRADDAQAAKKSRKKTPKIAAQDLLREQAAAGASRALREVYRKLASELHPDRERDVTERARKTGLMQQANQAYAAGDLLVLLELQLQMEQIDAKALAGMATDRLAHYNRVLDEQSTRLQEELAGVTAPYTMLMQGRMPRELVPDAVLRALDGDIRGLRAMLRSLEADRVAFQNIDELKSSLRHYRIGDADDDGLNIPAPRMPAAGRSRKRGR